MKLENNELEIYSKKISEVGCSATARNLMKEILLKADNILSIKKTIETGLMEEKNEEKIKSKKTKR
ncbi:hypothetical protein [uncultured Flavobacterium sp.]|jgi:hypothetical protein|uniref:hypothetical protein n=1 Tax=uncultured Flavobacterium sp. TaxID=165435 RepID=UPI00259546BE|nr:hypothetical protein [uncultured Flavobacterium sp.]